MPQTQARRGANNARQATPLGTPATRTRVKWRGGNVTIKPTHTSWRDFWGANYDATWISDQIDRAYSIGLNSIRIIGGVNGVVAGDYSRATYLARQQVVLDQCVRLGMWYYPCGAGDYTTTLDNATRDELVAHATALNGQPNVIGFDLLQEVDTFATQNSTTVAAIATTLSGWSTAVAAVNPTLSKTYSYGLHTRNPVVDIGSFVDHFDFHFYKDVPVDKLWGTQTKRFIIGEFGVSVSMSAAARVLRYQLAGYANRDYPLCSGAFAWALADQSATSTDQWGIFDNSGVERTDVTAILGDSSLFAKSR